MSSDDTLEEVRQLDVTHERVRQIEARALRNLKHPSRFEKLQIYADTLRGQTMARYMITSIDNNSIGAGGSAAKRGDFDDADAALACAEQLVNDALERLFVSARDEHELMAHYMVRGTEVPMIYGEPRVAFHAYQYARTRSTALFAKAGAR